jgi:hypothetical protein
MVPYEPHLCHTGCGFPDEHCCKLLERHLKASKPVIQYDSMLSRMAFHNKNIRSSLTFYIIFKHRIAATGQEKVVRTISNISSYASPRVELVIF